MKKHQFITLMVFVLTWVTAIEVGSRIQSQAIQLLTQLEATPVIQTVQPENSSCTESFSVASSIVAEVKERTRTSARYLLCAKL